MNPSGNKLRLACVQMEPRIGEVERNLARATELVERAAAAGAQLIVLPELCSTGYVFESRAEARALAESIPHGPASSRWLDLAAQHRVTLVAGIAELEGDRLFNSAIAVGPQGIVCRYRKNHLWQDENSIFEASSQGPAMFDLPGCRVAIAICYDIWFSDTFLLAAQRGADLLCVPTNWVPMPKQPDTLPPMANLLSMAGAHMHAIFVAAADRVGVERGQRFVGSSLVVGREGWPIAGPASADGEEVLIADLDLGEASNLKQAT